MHNPLVASGVRPRFGAPTCTQGCSTLATGTLSQDRYHATLAGIGHLIDLINPER